MYYKNTNTQETMDVKNVFQVNALLLTRLERMCQKQVSIIRPRRSITE